MKYFIFLSMTVIFNLNILAGPNDIDDPKDSELQAFRQKRDTERAQEAKDKQDLLVQEIFERRKLSKAFYTNTGLGDSDVYRLIRIFLREQDFIDYKYWDLKSPKSPFNLAIEEVFAGVDTSGDRAIGESKKALSFIGQRILLNARVEYLNHMLEEKYSDSQFQDYIYHASNFAIGDKIQRMLMEVLLRGEESIDYDFWSEKLPVNRVEEAIKETIGKFPKILKSRFEQNQEILREFTEHILGNAKHVSRKLKFERFANETAVGQRAQQLKKSNVININRAIEKSRK